LSAPWTGVAAALVSGVLSWAAIFLPESAGTRWGAGVLFGLLVLAPTRRDPAQRVALIAVSALVYRIAVWIAQELHTEAGWPGVVACALAGVAGVLMLAFGASAASRTLPSLREIAKAALPGVAGGALIGLAVGATDESIAQHALLIGGYVTWQVGYAAAHRLAPFSRAAT
jgi:hypothetical protein